MMMNKYTLNFYYVQYLNGNLYLIALSDDPFERCFFLIGGSCSMFSQKKERKKNVTKVNVKVSRWILQAGNQLMLIMLWFESCRWKFRLRNTKT